MRLCAKCGKALAEVARGVFQCPAHGVRKGAIRSAPRMHNTNNGSVCDSGPIELKGAQPSGKKNKKIKRTKWVTDYLEM